MHTPLTIEEHNGMATVLDAKGTELLCLLDPDMARTIVRAVNAHEQLVEALTLAERDLGDSPLWSHRHGATILTIRQALAALKEGA